MEGDNHCNQCSYYSDSRDLPGTDLLNEVRLESQSGKRILQHAMHSLSAVVVDGTCIHSQKAISGLDDMAVEKEPCTAALNSNSCSTLSTEARNSGSSSGFVDGICNHASCYTMQ